MKIMHVRLATTQDAESIINLYQTLIGTPGCAWSKEYPTMAVVQNDIANNSLYCMCDENNNIIAAASAGCTIMIGIVMKCYCKINLPRLIYMVLAFIFLYSPGVMPTYFLKNLLKL
ncbi:MAG TPA: hypothetical protein PK566_11190 [Pseudobacteroides sp.]|jgi:hypothetical protein|nr:hypothetical protein [Pseudobacteroides sp.]